MSKTCLKFSDFIFIFFLKWYTVVFFVSPVGLNYSITMSRKPSQTFGLRRVFLLCFLLCVFVGYFAFIFVFLSSFKFFFVVNVSRCLSSGLDPLRFASRIPPSARSDRASDSGKWVLGRAWTRQPPQAFKGQPLQL